MDNYLESGTMVNLKELIGGLDLDKVKILGSDKNLVSNFCMN